MFNPKQLGLIEYLILKMRRSDNSHLGNFFQLGLNLINCLVSRIYKTCLWWFIERKMTPKYHIRVPFKGIYWEDQNLEEGDLKLLKLFSWIND